MLYDRVKYILKYDGISKEIQEPKGWDDAKLSWLRSTKYHGIAINVSTALEFFGNGKDELICLYEDYGVNAIATLEIWQKNKYTDNEELFFVGLFDFSTFTLRDGVSIKFNASEIVRNFKKNIKTKIEYGRVDRLDGTYRDITDTYKDVTIKSMKSTRQSTTIMEYHTNKEYTMSFDAGGDWRQNSLPLNTEKSSGTCVTYEHDDMNDVADSSNWTSKPNIEGISDSFWSVSEATVTLQLTIKAEINFGVSFEGTVENRGYTLSVVVFGGDGKFVRTARTLYSKTDLNDGNVRFKISTSFNVSVAKNESISIQHRFGGNFGDFWRRGRYKINFAGYTNTANITVVTDTTLDAHTTKSILAKDFLISISDAAMNSDFASTYLDSGLFKDLMMANGFMLRAFMNEEDGYLPPSVSFEELFTGLNVINPIGVEVGGLIKLEEIDYFYGDYMYKDIGSVTNFELTIDKSKLYSQIDIGFQKSEKEEDGGDLIEFNAATEYVTTIIGATTKLDLKSKIRGDSTGIGKARRGYYEESDDTVPDECEDDKSKSKKSDNDLWFIDTIFVGGLYRSAEWGDHFSTIPEGIPNAGSYFNYRFTPRNIANRHIKTIRSGYHNLRDMRLVFGSTTGIKELVTYPIGEPSNKEGNSININLKEPLNIGMIATFETPYRFDDLNGYTNNKKNFYGMLRFRYKERMYLGHIMKVDLEGDKSKVECLIKIIIK